MNILVISSCTSTKAVSHPLQLTLDDFRHPQNPAHLQARKDEIIRAASQEGKSVALPAREMYTGRQHVYTVEAVTKLREVLGNSSCIRLQIISAGYGLLDETETILPYQATFNDMRKAEMLRYSEDVLHLPQKIATELPNYDLVFFLLGQKYLEAIRPESIPSRAGLIFVASTATRKWFPRQHRDSLVCFTNDDVKIIGGGQVGLKGAILNRLASILAQEANPEQRLCKLRELIAAPSKLRSMLQLPQQTRLPLPVQRLHRPLPTLAIPRQPIAKNATRRPLFFVPDWDDLVDPDYDFLEDAHPQGQFDPLEHGVYAHEIFDHPPYDGILISRAVLDNSNPKKRQAFDRAHTFLRWPEDGKVMGDCGAFSYVNEEMPPYSTSDVLNYYERHGFDIGVSVDHLIVGDIIKNEAERERRFRLTLTNAEEFLSKHRAGNYHYAPMGIAQGWDPKSYEEAVVALLDMGYKHIALGGLAFAKSQEVVDILARISPHFPEDLYVHIFGLAREELLDPYYRFGVTAFDSATFLRRSWMSARDNYLDPTTGQWYTAIRVPPSSFGVNGKRRYHKEVKRLIDSGEATLAEIEKAEKAALSALRAYGQRRIPLSEALEAVLAYDHLVMPKGDVEELYEWTLFERPWERCKCPICSDLGIDVIIFRQNDRNRRRGFHNTYAFRRIAEAKWTKH